MSETGQPRSRDEERLAELGYKQDLSRVWSKFSNFAISFSIISVLAGCFTTYGQAFNNGGPIAISWGWPIICALILTVAVSMSELCSAYPTAGGPYWWAAKLGGAGWSWFTGWFNVVGLIAVVASVDYACATFAANLFSLWDLNLIINFQGAVELDEVFLLFCAIMVLHALINIYSSHLVALFNNISVVVHVVGVAVIIVILIVIPDRHQSADFVFTDTLNNSGFSDGSSSNLFFWFYVLPVGFLLTMYTVTGYDASAHVSEETQDAERAAAQGVWQSVFISAVIGWFVLLAITFAAIDVGGCLGRRHSDLHQRHGRGLGRGRDPDLHDRAVLLRHGLRDELLPNLLCLLARPRRARLAHLEFGEHQARARRRRVRGLRARSDHHPPGTHQQRRRHPCRLLRRRLDRGGGALHRLRDPGLPAPAGGRPLPARGVDARREVPLDQHHRGRWVRSVRDHLLAALHPGGGAMERRVHLVGGQLLADHGGRAVRRHRDLVAREREEHLQGPVANISFDEGMGITEEAPAEGPPSAPSAPA